MPQIRSVETELDIELHFQNKDELPESERIDHKVKIVRLKEQGEFLIERDIDDGSKVCINAGSLKLLVPFDAFTKEVCEMLNQDFRLPGRLRP